MSSQNNALPSRRKTGPKRGNKQRVKKKAGKSVGKKIFNFFITIVIICVLLIGGYIGYLYMQFNQVIDDKGSKKVVAPEASAKVKPITILLLGTDYRPETKTNLSDVMMVATLNPETKSATMVSLPRDTRVNLDGYKVNKANAYYPIFLRQERDSGKKAKDQMKEMMSKYFDIKVDYVMVLNFQGFRDIVDALGGIDIDVDMDMCYVDKADGTNINLKKGEQHLEGKEALDYVRYRKTNCKPPTKGSDDISRNQRQNEVLHEILAQAKSFNGLFGAGKVLEAVGDNMSTDFESQQMKDMIKTYWNISKENVKYIPMTGTWKSPYIYLSDKELAEAKQALQDELKGKSSSSTKSSE